MVFIDYIFLFITILYSIFGYIKGFSKQLISLSVWILFLYIIFNYLPDLKYIVSSYVRLDDIYLKFFSIILLVISSVALIFILNLTLAKLIASTLFENSNRIIGFVISFVKSQIFILIFILLIYDTSIANHIFNNSILMPYYLQFFEYISNFDDSLFNTFEI
jgi:membrane protein required for colicin V production